MTVRSASTRDYRIRENKLEVRTVVSSETVAHNEQGPEGLVVPAAGFIPSANTGSVRSELSPQVQPWSAEVAAMRRKRAKQRPEPE